MFRERAGKTGGFSAGACLAGRELSRAFAVAFAGRFAAAGDAGFRALGCVGVGGIGCVEQLLPE